MAPVDPAQRSPHRGDLLDTVPPDSLPAFAQQSSVEGQEAYRYAAAHGEVLQYIPCFCGYTKLGYRHNGDCSIAQRLPDGRLRFTSHGAT